MMDLFFPQDLRSKAAHHGGRGGTRRRSRAKSRAIQPRASEQIEPLAHLAIINSQENSIDVSCSLLYYLEKYTS
jgi:hypothetical protein